jgi:hypothetical protein
MEGTWVNVGTEQNARFEHVHADGTRNKSDRTIPMLTDERPRQWRARFICRQCRADLERRWPQDG